MVCDNADIARRPILELWERSPCDPLWRHGLFDVRVHEHGRKTPNANAQNSYSRGLLAFLLLFAGVSIFAVITNTRVLLPFAQNTIGINDEMRLEIIDRHPNLVGLCLQREHSRNALPVFHCAAEETGRLVGSHRHHQLLCDRGIDRISHGKVEPSHLSGVVCLYHHVPKMQAKVWHSQQDYRCFARYPWYAAWLT